MTPLWRPTTKPEHDESLERFMRRFNESPPQDISMSMWKEERFIHDGNINLWGVVVHYDWEKRHDWEGERFPYETLGQFERKFVTEKGIELTIQSNKEETYFIVAWHRDFDEVIGVSRKTDYEVEEPGKMRTTRKFEIFSYTEMNRFKRWLLTTYRR